MNSSRETTTTRKNDSMITKVPTAKRWGVRGLLPIISLFALCLLSTPAQAVFGVRSFDGEVVNRDAGNNPVAATQAGSHPAEASTTIAFNDHFDAELSAAHPFLPPVFMPDDSVRTIHVELPPGFVGNPTAAERCTDTQLAQNGPGTLTECPPDSQVGTVRIAGPIINFPFSPGDPGVPVYNMVPPPGVPGAFGFRVGDLVPVHLRASVRSDSDYGLSIDIPDINQSVPILNTSLTFWGVPADPSHDAERKGGPTDAPRRAFLTNPTSCNGPVETRLTVTSWPGGVDRSRFLTHLPAPDQATLVGPENCDRLPFDISVDARPLTRKAATPSGYVFDLSIPQSDAPAGLAQAHLKKAVVRLPQGVSISPTAAAGLAACSDAQSGVGTNNDPSCPEAAKVGTLTVDTPLLDEQMKGAIYIAEPKPGNIFRLLLVAKGPGVVLKLPGTVTPDPKTGQLTATFDNNPQLPFSNLHLEFKDGPRAPLSNPSQCGTYTTTAEMTAWSGKTTVSTSSFSLSRDGNGAPCPVHGFNPSFSAGLMNPTAGASSTFSLTFARGDEDQTLRDITVDMPEGLTGVLASADLCGEAQASAGTCGERSRIGSTTAGAGQGTNPFFVPGRVYITGPYKGAPFGMSIVVPVIAGPFDLGTIVVRAAVFVDRQTARLRIVSDPLPTIVEGVPLLVRKVNITVDKPGFMLAPTSCAPKRISGLISSNEGGSASVGSRFQVGSCGALPYRPRLALKIGDKKHRRAESTAPLAVTLTMPRGDANNKSATVTLPKNVNSRLAALRGACSVEAARARSCGRGAVVGTAVAVTPLLRDPLTGPVYIVRTVGNRLPDLWVALRGQVEFDLIARVRVTRSLQLRTTFGEIPDVPVTKFRLNFISGRNAPIGLVRGICSARVRRDMVADLSLRAQNGRLVSRAQKMSIAGCGRRAAAKRRSSTRRSSGGRARRSAKTR
ncbi:MAG: hypothetical protein WBD40_14305 [Tepidisphaeraceae bacterium]